jgi:glyoxylase-like metal-dependent hydrolase (beta-lactamase superfamily II)
MSTEQLLSLFGEKVPPSPAGALPVVTFTDAVTFHLAGEEIHAFHAPPAHTDGDSIVHFRKADVIHVGDIFFHGSYPFVDLDSGGDAEGVLKAVERMLEMAGEGTKIIPGHGPLGTRADLVRYRDMNAGSRDAVAELIAAGKSREEAIEAKPTAAFDEAWGGGFIKPELWVGTLYDSLTR